jgi:hypothetical protein
MNNQAARNLAMLYGVRNLSEGNIRLLKKLGTTKNNINTAVKSTLFSTKPKRFREYLRHQHRKIAAEMRIRNKHHNGRINAISNGNFSSFTPEQIRAISNGNFSSFTPEQIRTIRKNITSGRIRLNSSTKRRETLKILNERFMLNELARRNLPKEWVEFIMPIRSGRMSIPLMLSLYNRARNSIGQNGIENFTTLTRLNLK